MQVSFDTDDFTTYPKLTSRILSALAEVLNAHRDEEIRLTYADSIAVAEVQTPSAMTDMLVDSAGEVWDFDKHTSTKTKTKEGRWKLKRTSTIQESMQEIEQLAKEQAADLVIPTLPPPPPPPAAEIFGGLTPPPPIKSDAAPPITGAEFAERFAKRVEEGTTNYIALMPVLKAEGFDLYPDLINRGTPEQLAAVWWKL